MTITYNIDPNKKSNFQTETKFNTHKNTIPKNSVDTNNNILIKYFQNGIDPDTNTTTLYDPRPTKDNDIRSVTLDWTPQSIRNFKYNILANTFTQGYPESFTYYFCPQKLATVFSTSTNHFTSIDQRYKIISQIQNNDNNVFLCGGDDNISNFIDCDIICPSGTTLDPASCTCTSPTICLATSGDSYGSPSPEPINYTDLQPVVSGFAYYVASPQYGPVYVPGIGDIDPACYGGHACDRTIFRPKVSFPGTDLSDVLSNRNINLNNLWGVTPSVSNILSNLSSFPDQITSDFVFPKASQIYPEGFYQRKIDIWNTGTGFFSKADSLYEQADTFTFTFDNVENIQSGVLTLDCQLKDCHNEVTFVALVGEKISDSSNVLLFASCVAPGQVQFPKYIGTIDSPDPESYAYDCGASASSVDIIP